MKGKGPMDYFDVLPFSTTQTHHIYTPKRTFRIEHTTYGDPSDNRPPKMPFFLSSRPIFEIAWPNDRESFETFDEAVEAARAHVKGE